MSSVVGIDLGTTNTVVATVRGGRVHVLADERGNRLLPSVVSFHPNGEVLVGRAAKERRLVDAKNTIGSIKRLIGRAWGSAELEAAKKRFPFELKEGPGHAPVIVTHGESHTLAEISALVLRAAKAIAEQALGDAVEKAVITVPANFNELQRASTKVAGRLAGIEVLRILNEPTAAALAYGFGRGGHERIAVYDFGGGTFDCTLLEMNGNVFEVLATAGDSFLGGDDIDAAIADRMAEAFLKQHRVDPRGDAQELERLRAAAEGLKIELSSVPQAQVHLREMAFGEKGVHLDLQFGLTRTELDAIMEPFVERTLKVCQDALSLAALSVGAFDKVILVGGSTRIPLVRQIVEKFFGAPPLDRLNPDEVVGIGAAIQAAALTDLARRRSIPPPPVPGARKSVSTLRGIDGPRPSSPSQPSPDETQPRPAMPSHPATDETLTRPRMTTARMGSAPAIPETELDIDPHKEVTRQLVAPNAPQLTSLAEGYAELPPTRPSSVPPPSANEMLTNSIPEPAESDVAPTMPFKRTPIPPEPPSTLDALPDEPTPAPTQSLRAQLTRTQPIAPVAGTPIGRINLAAASAPAPPPPLPDLPKAAPAFSPTSTQVMPSIRPLAVEPPNPPTVPPPAPLAPPILVDVTPRALVVETVGGFCDTVIPRNSRIPCSRSRAFSPGRDYQTTVRIRVAQGESSLFVENTYLGELELSGLRAAPRGEVTVAVSFDIDASGIARVRATDTATGREARATLQLVGVAQEESIARLRETTLNRKIVNTV